MKIKIFALIVIASFMAGGLSACKSCGHAGHEGGEHQAVYYCPMHPSYTADKPGTCPICGMNLVLKGDATAPKMDDGKGRATIFLPEERQQKIGLKTVKVVKKDAVKDIRANARVAYDPDLAQAQSEYLTAVRLGDKALVGAAKQRLVLLGMYIDDIEKLKAVQNSLILPTDSFWVYPVFYEYELPFVSLGQTVTVELKDGRTFNGVVRSVDPVLDPQTRTARLHVEVQNAKDVRPEMSGTAVIHVDMGERLVIPKSAVISTGNRNVVFVVDDISHFYPRDIKLGPELTDEYIVADDLKEGETVVTGATFLVDSESKLKAAVEGDVKQEHQH